MTVIEFVSPTNKRQPALQDFRAKRAHSLAGGVNFVEIDLVRTGDWETLLRPYRCPPEKFSTYRASVWIADRQGEVGLYPISLREQLPSIVIPLRHTDPELSLELQPLLDKAYLNGRYGRRLDYRQPLEVPLNPDDAAWAEELIRTRAG